MVPQKNQSLLLNVRVTSFSFETQKQNKESGKNID
jgi:hypothetical protein